MDKTKTPQASPSQKKELDILMNGLGVDTVQMMELAGERIARVVLKHTKGPVMVFCGKGHNGGDGLCAAKYLLNWNIPVAVILVEDEKKYSGEEKKHLFTLKQLGASVFRWGIPDLPKFIEKTDLVVDALLGFGIKSEPRGNVKKTIEFINKYNKKILSVDIPTGIDALTGEAMKTFLKANYTVALGIPLKGCINNKNVGKLYVADIGIPDKVYTAAGIEYKANFKKKSVIKL